MSDVTNETEGALRDRLLAGTATLEEGLRLYALMTERGGPFPLAWEERLIRLALAADPDRADLSPACVRCSHRRTNRFRVSSKTEFAQQAAREERARNHQRDAAEYHIRTAMADMEEAFLPMYEACRAYTMTSVERMYALYKAVEYVEARGHRG